MNVFVLKNTKEDILKNMGNRAVLGHSIFFSYYGSQWCPKSLITNFLQISSFVFLPKYLPHLQLFVVLLCVRLKKRRPVWLHCLPGGEISWRKSWTKRSKLKLELLFLSFCVLLKVSCVFLFIVCKPHSTFNLKFDCFLYILVFSTMVKLIIYVAHLKLNVMFILKNEHNL